MSPCPMSPVSNLSISDVLAPVLFTYAYRVKRRCDSRLRLFVCLFASFNMLGPKLKRTETIRPPNSVRTMNFQAR